jgi:hypothetical protein
MRSPEGRAATLESVAARRTTLVFLHGGDAADFDDVD